MPRLVRLLAALQSGEHCFTEGCMGAAARCHLQSAALLWEGACLTAGRLGAAGVAYNDSHALAIAAEGFMNIVQCAPLRLLPTLPLPCATPTRSVAAPTSSGAVCDVHAGGASAPTFSPGC